MAVKGNTARRAIETLRFVLLSKKYTRSVGFWRVLSRLLLQIVIILEGGGVATEIN
jgi:hypothetical protein